MFMHVFDGTLYYVQIHEFLWIIYYILGKEAMFEVALVCLSVCFSVWPLAKLLTIIMNGLQ